jgi:alkanesulfonate monooxygenase SsuD/methylene tetrahydromethanopterin reductase-like flavin-dependent oxidoreductase (luciferase family)
MHLNPVLLSRRNSRPPRHKGQALERHCAAVQRDPAQITPSANMPCLITDEAAAGEKLVQGLMRRFGGSETEARDTVLSGSVAQIQDKISQLQKAGVDLLLLPTFLPMWNLEHLERFITEVAPTFR